jgi:uncharacterized membrane protein HdeD (DUF308 family)
MSTTARKRSDADSTPVAQAEAVAARSSDGSTSPPPVPRRAYYIYLARATFVLALGVALLLTGSTLSNLATFIAVYWILAALVTLRWVGANSEGRGRRIGLIAGGAALAAGVALALRHPLGAVVGEEAVMDFLGATAIAMGLLRLSGWLHDDQLKKEHPRRRYRIVGGLMDVVLGLALITASARTSTGITLVVGAWALSTGTLLLLDGLTLRRLVKSQRAETT